MDRTTDDRFMDIENELRTSTLRMDNISTALENINDALRALATGHAPQNQTPPLHTDITADDEEFVLPPTGEAASAAIAPTARVSDRLRPNRPPAFDGERANGRAFLNACRLYMTICASEFKDDETRINWVLSYMSIGRAAKFSARAMRHLSRTGVPMFAGYAEFQKYFVANFCPVDEEMTAALALNDDAYFQGKRSVDEYIDEFTDLLEDAGLDDGLQVVLMFRKGLDPAIRTRIAEMVDGRPNDKMLQQWITAARRVERNTLADRRFANAMNRNFRSPASQTAKTAQTATANLLPRGIWRMPTAVPHAPTAVKQNAPPAAPTLHPGVPMDIDAARRKGKEVMLCRRCNKPGHFARECPHQFDVRYMTAGERDDWAMEMLAQVDASTANETATGVFEPEPENEAASAEGF